MEYFGFCRGIKSLNMQNTFEVDIYSGPFADFYDDYVREGNDINIYKELSNAYGKRILELACGSGRVMLPLLEYGLDVTGVDISQDMLSILERKCNQFAGNGNLINTDMCEFSSDLKFDIIILAQCSLCLLDNDEKRLKLFRNTFNNLRKGGIFIFNYIDTPKDDIKVGDKKTVYIFNAKNKSFAVISEKMCEDKMKTIANIYLEKENIEGEVKRYLTSTTKYVLDELIVKSLIRETGFVFVNEISGKTNDGDVLRYQILKRL